MPASRAVPVLAALTLVLGCASAVTADLVLFTFDDTCPQWEDEGSMAAPGSPYSQVLCGPGTEPPFTWAVYAGCALAAALVAVVLVRRRDSAARAVPWLALALVGPTLLVLLLHVTLPRDCASGRTETGDCSRDREMR